MLNFMVGSLFRGKGGISKPRLMDRPSLRLKVQQPRTCVDHRERRLQTTRRYFARADLHQATSEPIVYRKFPAVKNAWQPRNQRRPAWFTQKTNETPAYKLHLNYCQIRFKEHTPGHP
jgi:hypothetical protein